MKQSVPPVLAYRCPRCGMPTTTATGPCPRCERIGCATDKETP